MRKRLVVLLLIALTCLLSPLGIHAVELSPNNLLPLWPDPAITPLLTDQYPDIDAKTASEIMNAVYGFMQENQDEWAGNTKLTFDDMIKLAKELQAVYPSSIPIPAEGGGFGIGFTNGIPYLSASIPLATMYVGGLGFIINSGIAIPIIPLELVYIGMPYMIHFHVLYANGLKYWIEGYWAPHVTIPYLGTMIAHIPPGDALVTVSAGGVSFNLYRSGGAQYFNIYIPLGSGFLSDDSQVKKMTSDAITAWFPETMKIMDKLTSGSITAEISDQDKQKIQNEADIFKNSMGITQ